MFKRLFAATALVAVATVASAGITAELVPFSSGTLPTAGTAYATYRLNVTVTADDAWSVAGGLLVGDPWMTTSYGTFYQDAMNDSNPPNPMFFGMVPDSEFTSYYTTPLSYPNVPEQGPGPSFAGVQVDTPTALQADWFMTSEDPIPGTFTIAQVTILPDDPGNWWMTADMLIGSKNVAPFHFNETVGVPEPASLALLALGGLALIRRR